MAIRPFQLDEDDVAMQRRINDMLDWGLLLGVIGLLGIGLTSIYSAAFGLGSDAIFRRQVLYAVVGIGAGVGMFFVPERWLNDFAYPIYAIGILLLLAVLSPLGHVVNGQRCWIQIGSFSFQPSELAKITTLIAVAKYTGRKGFSISTIRDLIWIGILFLLPVALIMLQPDTGSATVFLAMALGVYMWTGGDLFVIYSVLATPFVALSSLYGLLFDNIFYFVAISALFCLGTYLFRRTLTVTITACILVVGVGFAVQPVFDKLETYQKKRLITLFEPERNPRGEGYHVIQSILAVGSGGITGKGFLQGTQTQLRYIPEQWTDFIFCVPTEEFGFMGGIVVITLLGFVALRSAGIAASAKTSFSSVIAIGFASLLLFHTMVNIGMAVGLFPVMGIPLPFLSAGGTALIGNTAIIGLLLNMYRQRRRRAA
ncbi:MAG TPA: rod shape-determining protein RodA [Bacteroidetes bacterium]|nr:rod shape-determining protein RodA [Bacteroidota bacterium]